MYADSYKLLASILFFFSGYRPNQALPSFPTRRSSDLNNAAFRGISSMVTPKPAIEGHLKTGHRAAARTCVVLPRLYGRRSEEHTSELQSRLHLVCRLLLEKKK